MHSTFFGEHGRNWGLVARRIALSQVMMIAIIVIALHCAGIPGRSFCFSYYCLPGPYNVEAITIVLSLQQMFEVLPSFGTLCRANPLLADVLLTGINVGYTTGGVMPLTTYKFRGAESNNFFPPFYEDCERWADLLTSRQAVDKSTRFFCLRRDFQLWQRLRATRRTKVPYCSRPAVIDPLRYPRLTCPVRSKTNSAAAGKSKSTSAGKRKGSQAPDPINQISHELLLTADPAAVDVSLAAPKRRKQASDPEAEDIVNLAESAQRKSHVKYVRKPRGDPRQPGRPKKVKSVESELVEADLVDGQVEDASDPDWEDEDEETQALVQTLDSSNEVDIAVEEASSFKQGQDVGKAPVPHIASRPKKNGATSAKGAEDRGVMYVGRVPHGFFEHEMRAYFSQFGPVTKLRVSRNKKTGASKGYAFVEFEDAATCDIAAKTMDGYLLFGHILRCKVIPQDQVPEGLWKGANRRFKKVPWSKLAARRLERPASEATWESRITKEERRRAERAEKLKEMGYTFEGPALKGVTDATEAATASLEEAKSGVETLVEHGSGKDQKDDSHAAADEVEAQTAEKPALGGDKDEHKTKKSTKANPKPLKKESQGTRKSQRIRKAKV